VSVSTTRAWLVISKNRNSSRSAWKRPACAAGAKIVTSASSGAPIAPAARNRSRSRATSALSAINAGQSIAGTRSVPTGTDARYSGTPIHCASPQETPHLFGGETQDGCQPAHHRLSHVMHGGLRRAARCAARARGVEPILDDVQIEPAELDDAEIVDLLVDVVKFVVAVRGDDVVLQGEGLGRSPLIDRHQVIERDRMLRGIEAVQIANRNRSVLRMRR